MIYIILILFIIIFLIESKYDSIISKGKFTKKDNELWHKLDLYIWFILITLVSFLYTSILKASNESFYILKGVVSFLSIGALRNLVFNPMIAKRLGKSFFYLGQISKIDKFINRTIGGKVYWFLNLLIIIVTLIINYIL